MPSYYCDIKYRAQFMHIGQNIAHDQYKIAHVEFY